MFRLEPVINGYDPLIVRETWSYLCAPRLEAAYNRHMTDTEVAAENTRANLRPKRLFWLVPCAEAAAALPGKQALFPPAQLAYIDSGHGGCPTAPGSVPLASARITQLPVHPGMRRTDNTTDAIWLPWFDSGPGHSELVLGFTANAAGTGQFQFWNAETGETMPGRRFEFLSARKPQEIRVPLPDFTHIDAALNVRLEDTGAFVVRGLALWEDTADLTAHARVIKSGPNDIAVAIEDLPRDAYLVRAASLYPGWQAWLDGERVTIERADSAFQAVRVPAGTHEVRFRFRPGAARTGLLAGVVSAILARAALAAALWKRDAGRSGHR